MATPGYIFIEEIPNEIQRPPIVKKAIATSVENIGGVDVHSFRIVFVAEEGSTVTVNAPVGTPVFVRLSDGSSAIATLPVSLASVPSHAVTNAGTFAIQDSEKIADNAAFIDGTSKVQPIGYIFDETSGTALTENDIGAARIDSKRAQVFVIEDATTRGQRVAVNSENALKTDNLGSTPVTISNLTNSAQNVVTSPARLCHIRCNNTLGVTVFIQVFNDLQGNAVLGTPTTYFEIPAYSNLNENFFSPPKFSTAISIALTTAKNNAVAPPSPLDVIAHYSTLN